MARRPIGEAPGPSRPPAVVGAAQVGIGPVGEDAHGTFRQHPGEGGVDGLEDPGLNGRAAAGGSREARVEEGARLGRDLQPAEGPLVLRDPGSVKTFMAKAA